MGRTTKLRLRQKKNLSYQRTENLNERRIPISSVRTTKPMPCQKKNLSYREQQNLSRKAKLMGTVLTRIPRLRQKTQKGKELPKTGYLSLLGALKVSKKASA